MTCVFCSKTTTLNTSMTITLADGNKVSVDVCDEHAEEATIKSCREAYEAKQSQIEELLAKAKELGLNISQISSGLTIVKQPVSEVQNPTIQAIDKKPKTPTLDTTADDVVPTSKIDRRPIQSVGGTVGGTSVPSLASHATNDLSDKLPAEVSEGYAKMAVMEGREGQPLVIPQKRVDGTGTTRIIIRKTEDDRTLQERFKRVAKESQSSYDNAAGPDFRSGYQDTTRDCPFCRGEMEINGKECPKCKGTGLISVY